MQGQQARQYTHIRRGQQTWDDFLQAVDHENTEVYALFDYHDVVSEMSHDEAADIGVNLEFIDGVTPLILSRARAHHVRRSVFENTSVAPMIRQCEGVIFTDLWQSKYDVVDVYQEKWMQQNVIAVYGDKGQVGNLLQRRAILFDVDEDNLDLFLDWDVPHQHKAAALVRIGQRHRSRVRHSRHRDGHWDCVSRNPHRWPDIVRTFYRSSAPDGRWPMEYWPYGRWPMEELD